MALTPLMLTAMNGFLNNNSIQINADFLTEINIYTSQPIVKKYRELFGGNYYYKTSPPTMPINTILPRIKAMYVDIPFIADIYNGNNCGTSADYFSEYLLDWSYMILATHRNMTHSKTHAKFIQTFQTVLGYVEQMDGAINSAVNGGSVGASTFTSMDEITTGNLSAVTTSTSTFGDELITTGKLLDFSELQFYGSPHGLMLALIRTNAIRLLTQEFLRVGIIIGDLTDAIIDSPIALLPEVQKTIYTVMQGVTGKKLTDIMLMLNTNIDNISVLSELLDTRKIFPGSVNHLQAMVNKELVPLYNSPGVSSVLENIIPPTMARYNIEFRNTLLQVKGIVTTSVQELAEQFKTIESTAGLDDINSFESALPGSVVSSNPSDTVGPPTQSSSSQLASYSGPVPTGSLNSGILNIIANGQGENGLFYITDGVGTPCGTTHLDTMIAMNDYHNTILDSLEQSIVNKEQEIVDESWIADAEYRLDNDEPIRSDYPAGPQGDDDFNNDWNAWNNDRIAYINNAIQPFFNELQILINQLPPAPNSLSDQFEASLTQIKTEKFTLGEALDWPINIPDQINELQTGGLCAGLWNMITVPSSKKIILGFTESLHSLSLKTDLHDAVEVLEKLSKANQGGDAIIGSLREGRNLKKLDDAGVKTDTRISAVNKNAQPGEIKPSET